MRSNPFLRTRAEDFNHAYDELAGLFRFKPGTADVLLGRSNVFIEGSRGSGKSTYLKVLSLEGMSAYKEQASKGTVDPLPKHDPFIGTYVKLAATMYGPHECEDESGFDLLFQQIFNLHCMKEIVRTIMMAINEGHLSLDAALNRELAASLSSMVLARRKVDRLADLEAEIGNERLAARVALNSPPYSPDTRAQPDILWSFAEDVLRRCPQWEGARVYLLVDEYDYLSETQQRILNTYLRKRDFPITFKIGVRKHRLSLLDRNKRPLNQPDDYVRVELDDDDYGIGGTYCQHLEEIANRRLEAAGFDLTIRGLLGEGRPQWRSRAERRYHGFEFVSALSSGIVRRFLELCRDVFDAAGLADEAEPLHSVRPMTQDNVIKNRANQLWECLAERESGDPQLQLLVERTVQLFRQKAGRTAEKQIIRLEVLDYTQLPGWLRELLHRTLEYEAFIQPNRQRLEKNRQQPSRGFVLNRLLCAHFRLEPTSRWDVEISPVQLQRLVLGPAESVEEIAARSSERRARKTPETPSPDMFSLCPVIDAPCAPPPEEKGLGFLAIRLPRSGKIRDAERLLKSAIPEIHPDRRLQLKTAEDYPTKGDIACKACKIIDQSEFALFEMSKGSPNVILELGMSVARQKLSFILFNTEEEPDPPPPFTSLEYIHYDITESSVREKVAVKVAQHLEGRRGRTGLLPLEDGLGADDKRVFVSLPGTVYHQETVLPRLKDLLRRHDLDVVSEYEGRALQDLVRAAKSIQSARFCLIDTTQGAPSRVFYLGMALGFRRTFGNLIDEEEDPQAYVFTDARDKAVVFYRGLDDLLERVSHLLERWEVRKP